MRTKLYTVSSGSSSRSLRRCFLVLSLLTIALFALCVKVVEETELFRQVYKLRGVVLRRMTLAIRYEQICDLFFTRE